MTRKLLEELRSFAETTSVRGIPRVMKAKTRVTFVVWLVAVLTCAALLVWQLSVVLMRYFQYSVSTLPVQSPAWQRPTFPDITVCNLDAYVYFETDYLDSDLNYVATENKSFLYTTKNSPIIQPSYFLLMGIYLNFSADVTAAWDPVYYKCFTMRPPNSERENIRGLTVTLYVDQVRGTNITGNVLSVDPSGAAGMRALVHPPGAAPDMTYGVTIGSSTETNMLLTQTLRTRLGPPYSKFPTARTSST